MMTAGELGVAGQIERIQTDVWQEGAPVTAANPIGQIPTLVSDEGEALYDSLVICEYLDARFGQGRLMARDGAERWRVMRQRALGYGLLNAAVIRTLEVRRRPEALRWEGLLSRQKQVMARIYDALEGEAATFADRLDLGQIVIACALGYSDLRLGDDKWRDGRPELARWHRKVSARQSFLDSAPPAVAA
jgi:glutathione S-transferase